MTRNESMGDRLRKAGNYVELQILMDEAQIRYTYASPTTQRRWQRIVQQRLRELNKEKSSGRNS